MEEIIVSFFSSPKQALPFLGQAVTLLFFSIQGGLVQRVLPSFGVETTVAHPGTSPFRLISPESLPLFWSEIGSLLILVFFPPPFEFSLDASKFFFFFFLSHLV